MNGTNLVKARRSFDLGLEKAMALDLDGLRWRLLFKMPVINSILHYPPFPSPKTKVQGITRKPFEFCIAAVEFRHIFREQKQIFPPLKRGSEVSSSGKF